MRVKRSLNVTSRSACPCGTWSMACRTHCIVHRVSRSGKRGRSALRSGRSEAQTKSTDQTGEVPRARITHPAAMPGGHDTLADSLPEVCLASPSKGAADPSSGVSSATISTGCAMVA